MESLSRVFCCFFIVAAFLDISIIIVSYVLYSSFFLFLSQSNEVYLHVPILGVISWYNLHGVFIAKNLPPGKIIIILIPKKGTFKAAL